MLRNIDLIFLSIHTLKLIDMKNSVKFILLLAGIILLSAHNMSAQQTEETFEGNVSFSYKYLLYLPDGYESDKEIEYPFLLFLHGGGEKGDEGEGYRLHCFVASEMCRKRGTLSCGARYVDPPGRSGACGRGPR